MSSSRVNHPLPKSFFSDKYLTSEFALKFFQRTREREKWEKEGLSCCYEYVLLHHNFAPYRFGLLNPILQYMCTTQPQVQCGKAEKGLCVTVRCSLDSTRVYTSTGRYVQEQSSSAMRHDSRGFLAGEKCFAK